MKAIRIHQYGGPDQLKVDEVPEPAPVDNEVKIRVKASSLNHLDVWIRQGLLKALNLPLPLVPGSDGCGVVADVGSNVSSFKAGDRVFWNPGFGCEKCDQCQAGHEELCLEYKILGEHCNGTHQQFLCLPESRIISLPNTVSFEEGAAFPLVFMTAWHMLIEKAKIQPGEDVLIMAGASGVSSAGIQISKLKGARVITTVGSEEAAKKALELGADETIDHYKEDIGKRTLELTEGKGADVIFDHVGAKTWKYCLKALAKGGRLVTCGATTGPEVSVNLRHVFMKHQQILGSTMGNKRDLEEIVKWISEKKLKPVIHQVLPYTDVAKGHEMLEKGGIFGKVILKW